MTDIPQPYKHILLKGCYGLPKWEPLIIKLAGDSLPEHADEEDRELTHITINEIYKWYKPLGLNKSGEYEFLEQTIVRHDGDEWALRDSAVRSTLESFIGHPLVINDKYDQGRGESLVRDLTQKFEGDTPDHALAQFEQFWDEIKQENWGQIHTVEPFPAYMHVEMGNEMIAYSSELLKIIREEKSLKDEGVKDLLSKIALTLNNEGGFLADEVHRIYTSNKCVNLGWLD